MLRSTWFAAALIAVMVSGCRNEDVAVDVDGSSVPTADTGQVARVE